MQEHMKLLGFKVRDVVTGFAGVVTSISFDLYGCVQAIVTPDFDKKKGEQTPGHWFDVKRLQSLGKAPVMPVPAFATEPPENIAGGQTLPPFASPPQR